MSQDWEAAWSHVARLTPAQQAYWRLTLERLKQIETLVPEEVSARLNELRAIAPPASKKSTGSRSLIEHLVDQLVQELADQLSWREGEALKKLADPFSEHKVELWQTLHAARKRLYLEKPVEPLIDKLKLNQLISGEELCLLWRCLGALLLLARREVSLANKWREELARVMDGAKNLRRERLRKRRGDIMKLLTMKERSLLVKALGSSKS